MNAPAPSFQCLASTTMLLGALTLGTACDGGESGPSGASPRVEGGQSAPSADNGTTPSELTFKSDVEPVRSVDEALPGVFIPPFEHCMAPLDGVAGQGPDGQVCTPVSIAGATEPGRYFPDYADCDVVRRQRPYWAAAPTSVAADDDPRLADSTYLADLDWVKSQIEATGCTCCHDSREIDASQWDIAAGPLWLDSLSDTGLALFAGLADSVVLGAYPPEQDFGFSRDVTGIPTTDPARMQGLMLAELSRRGLSEDWARAVPPFGGPIYDNSVAEPTQCEPGQGVAADGRVLWTGGSARYVYVQQVGAKNPGVPPNLDMPENTLWRLDVLASQPALDSGVPYGRTPAGSFQVWPEASAAPDLTEGTQYKLVVLYDVGIPLVNCLFTFGSVQDAVPTASTDGGTTPTPDADAGTAQPTDGDGGSAGTCNLPGGDARGFGAPCNDTENHSDCPCAEASYCAKSPFDTQGYCTAPLSSCDGDTSICPDGWGCFDVSTFAPGEPAICSKP